MSEPNLFTPGFSKLSLDEQLHHMPLHHIMAALTGPVTLCIDPAGWGPLDKIPKEKLAKIHNAIQEKTPSYHQEIVYLFEKFVGLRRHPAYTSEPFRDAKQSKEITTHAHSNTFLFGSIPPNLVSWLWTPPGTIADDDFRAVQHMVTDPRSPMYTGQSESDGHFTMRAYVFPEAFDWVYQQFAREDKKYATYPHLVAGQVRLRDTYSCLDKAARAAGKRLDLLAVGDPRKLTEQARLKALEESAIKDIGGVQLYVLGEEPSHIDTIVTLRTMSIIDRDKDISGLVKKIKVKNLYENRDEAVPELKELKVWVIATELLPLAIFDEAQAVSGVPLEIKVTDLRNYGLLEASANSHTNFDRIRQHTERHDTGEHAVLRREIEQFRRYLRGFRFP